MYIPHFVTQNFKKFMFGVAINKNNFCFFSKDILTWEGLLKKKKVVIKNATSSTGGVIDLIGAKTSSSLPIIIIAFSVEKSKWYFGSE